ncbi:MAG: glucose-1-phosphate adenylyltransferase [Desulfofustis sp. PB-SRB1]|jgi:glucose-1-phosphate adenylyltransferase|nr:glucose-1-phosphate adenylyltransferase [Desulfofustis sp. PB-SRB1]MBM1002134.1 glucose-1-phosphate adenylyltransferase [Desulfofustis sp. PB-SRB1]HBH30026.1 glucose-1-phosphate adenylyltransferase [Desulfofustis sp.]
MLKPTTLAMILAGGRADDLNVLTYYRPKAAVPFGGFARVIDFALSNLMNSGIEQVAILSQYRSYSLINHIGTGAAWDMIGRYRGVSILPPFIDSEQNDWYRGSADAVYKNLDYIQYSRPEDILILSGDHIYQMDYQDIIDYHHEKGADLTMACRRIDPRRASRFGMAMINDEDGDRGGKVVSYQEKPRDPEGEWSSLTVLCFKPEVLYRVLTENQADDSFEFGRDIIPRLMEQGRRIYGYKFHGYWGYTRTVQEYWQANMDLLGERPLIDMEQWGIRTNLDHRGLRDFQPAIIGPHAKVSNSLLYNGCEVEGEVRNSVLFPGVHINAGSVVEDSVIFFSNKVGADCRLHKLVSDVNTIYEDGVEIGGTTSSVNGGITVVGWNNQVPANTKIGSGVTVTPILARDKWEAVIESGRVLK